MNVLRILLFPFFILVTIGVVDIGSAQEKGVVLQKIYFKKNDSSNNRMHNLDLLFIRRIKKKYIGKAIDGALLVSIVEDITNQYVEDGFITSRAYIEPQDISSGDLIITLVEGSVDDVVIRDGKNIVDSNYLRLLRKGGVLNLKDIEQDLDRYHRLRSKKATFSIEPGAAAHSSRITVNEESNKKWFFSSGVDNDGSKSKGLMQWFNQVTLEDVFRSKEIISVFYRRTLEDRNIRYNNSYSGSISIPFYYGSIDISASKNIFRNYVHASNKSYSLKGSSKSFKIGCDYIMHRNGTGKTSVVVAGAIDDYSNYLANNRIDISSYLIRKVELGTRGQRVLGGNIISFDITGVYGENLKFLRENLAKSIYDKNFAKIAYRFILLRPLQSKIANNPLEYQAQIFGQAALTPLVGSEKGIVGGLHSVRGFKENAESADSTIVFRNDLTLRAQNLYTSPYLAKIFGELNIFTAVDIGRFRNHETKGYRYGTLAGVAAGIKNREGLVNYSLTVARAAQKLDDNKISNEIYFNLAVDV